MKFEIGNMELKISKFLRAGVIISGLFMLAGWLLRVTVLSDPFYPYQHYVHIPLQELLIHHIANEQWGILVSYVGLFLLISLPVIRVLMTGILFFLNGERPLALVAGLVLLGLLLSFTLGIEI